MTRIISKSEEDTVKAAQELAETLPSSQIIFLNGNLGMGKTVFARALIRALRDEPELEVVSPTFTLVQVYEADEAPIFHFDLYRIEDPDEIIELGWDDAIIEGIVIIEWPERLGPYKPASYLDITITNSDNQDNHREILIERK